VPEHSHSGPLSATRRRMARPALLLLRHGLPALLLLLVRCPLFASAAGGAAAATRRPRPARSCQRRPRGSNAPWRGGGAAAQPAPLLRLTVTSGMTALRRLRQLLLWQRGPARAPVVVGMQARGAVTAAAARARAPACTVSCGRGPLAQFPHSHGRFLTGTPIRGQRTRVHATAPSRPTLAAEARRR
jgi:hypothetical protein